MKRKIICVILCFMMILQLSVPAFAESIVKGNKSIEIDLKLSDNYEDVIIMAGSGLEKLGVTDLRDRMLNLEAKEVNKNYLTIKLLSSAIKKEGLIVSGFATLDFDGIQRQINFSNSKLNLIRLADSVEIYEGVLRGTMDVNGETKLATVDIVATKDFSKVVSTVSVGAIEENSATLFFGDIFTEYEMYYNEIVQRLETENESVVQNLSNTGSEQNRNFEQYVDVLTMRNTTLGGVSGGETIVMHIAKRDFRDRNSIDAGFELISVFGRSGNALQYVSDATSAIPKTVNVTFRCHEDGFLRVDHLTPDTDNVSMPAGFDIVASLPYAGTPMAVLETLVTGLVGSVYAEQSNDSGFFFDNVAEFELSDFQNAPGVDLPNSISWANAISSGVNGARCHIEYRNPDASNATSARVTVEANMLYSFYYSTHRIVTKQTGTIVGTHYLFKN